MASIPSDSQKGDRLNCFHRRLHLNGKGINWTNKRRTSITTRTDRISPAPAQPLLTDLEQASPCSARVVSRSPPTKVQPVRTHHVRTTRSCLPQTINSTVVMQSMR
ncbi:hypothetical protein NG791_23160 [Laspinema sp. D1]|uniref:hypothetical protein n=1 Tax=Laspinema palackyanum TaxID=3231601 RepID=UPI0034967DDA|nr:hypothetical protein [Laspinema sp. D2b]